MKYECHGHIILDGVSYAGAVARHENGADEAVVRKGLAGLRAHGVGFFRDGGDRHGVSALARRIAWEYGIDYRTPVYLIHRRGRYGGLFGRAYGTPEEYRALVREAKARGADFVKLAVSGMLDFSGRGEVMGEPLGAEELRMLVDMAGEEGLRVMAHVNGAENIKNALRAGAGSIEHGFWPDRETAALFIETGAVWVPTCAAVQNLVGTGRFPDGALRGILDAQRAALTEAYAGGAYIASGSDSGAGGVLPGAGTDDEYAILARYGIDPSRGNERISARFKR